MPRQAMVYRVLIASPSDVVSERKAVPEVIHSWNAANSVHYGVVLEPVLWETHATPEMGATPQAIINRQLVENCDILVGTFWTRLGTYTGTAASGTVEEIEEFRKAGKPVLLYFSSVLVVPESVDAEQYKRLVQFKEHCQKEGLVSRYESIGELREQLQRHITSTVNLLHGPPEDAAKKGEDDDERAQRSTLEMFGSQFESFLRRFEVEWNAERDSAPVNIDEGKDILQRACTEVLGFRVQIVRDQGSKLSQILDEVARRLKAIQRRELYMDGGHSFRQFWNEGDEILNLLKTVPGEIKKILE